MSLEYGILGFLWNKDLSGYELKKAFDISCTFIWSANQGQIYRTLENMLKKGLVDITETAPGLRHEKKTYCITKQGRAALKSWLEEETLTESPVRNEALLKLFHMAKADPDRAVAQVDKLIATKKQIAAIFDQMTITRAEEYREVLDLAEDSPDYRLNLFLSKWGYLREQAFLSYLEQYRAEILKLGREK